MHAMTAGNLRSAYGGESMAHMRYLAWGNKAAKDGFPNVARLFRAIAHAERVHAMNHFARLRGEGGDYLVPSMAAFGLGSTSANLVGAIGGETFEVEEMYPAYLETAERQGEKAAVVSFNYALEAEKTHAALFTRAKEAVDGGHDLELRPVQICEVCGWTYEGEAPEECPICGAGRDKLTAFA
ncbi:MAG: rubrerythrin family protein [Armatimonadota bacterium]|nr:MAG: rubrerythrin family protein [Armatimonadota bacterium]